MEGRPSALRRAAMTRGKRVYPIMQTDCMKELDVVVRDSLMRILEVLTYCLPEA